MDSKVFDRTFSYSGFRFVCRGPSPLELARSVANLLTSDFLCVFYHLLYDDAATRTLNPNNLLFASFHDC